MTTSARAEQPKLRRVLGFWPAYGAAVGLVVSGTAMVSVGNVAGSAGRAAVLTGLIALVPMMAAAFAYGELTAMLPGGGMISEYTMPALGRFAAVFAVLSGYLVLISTDGGTQQVIGGLSVESLTGIPQYVVSWLLLGIVVLLNLFGVALYGRTEAIMTVGMMAAFLLIGLAGVAQLGETWGVAEPLAEQAPFFPAGGAWLTAVGVAIWWFIGFEFACPIAEENVKPHRNIPRALWIGLISIYVFDVIFVWGISRYTPTDILTGSSIPHVDAAELMLGSAGKTVMTLLTIGAAITTANAEMAALPRMLYGMAREGLVPSFFAYIHPKYRTPWLGILFTTFLMGITTLYATLRGADIGIILTLILTACIAWMVSYAIAMVDVIVLRVKYPNYPRLWKAPGGIVTMVIGLVGVAYAIYTLADYLLYSLIYMALIAVYTFGWLKYKGFKLAETTPIEYVAKEIMDRSEKIQEWDDAVDEWLAHREWDHAGYVEYRKTAMDD